MEVNNVTILILNLSSVSERLNPFNTIIFKHYGFFLQNLVWLQIQKLLHRHTTVSSDSSRSYTKNMQNLAVDAQKSSRSLVKTLSEKRTICHYFKRYHILYKYSFDLLKLATSIIPKNCILFPLQLSFLKLHLEISYKNIFNNIFGKYFEGTSSY